ncbi:unnamed protein product [Prunus armeniaca]
MKGSNKWGEKKGSEEKKKKQERVFFSSKHSKTAPNLQKLKIPSVSECPDLERLAPPRSALLRLAPPCNASSRLLRAKRATREAADRLGRFPAASLRSALRRARKHAFENTDLPKFYNIVSRLLKKPGGVFTVCCYNDIEVGPTFDPIMKRFHDTTLPFWDKISTI